MQGENEILAEDKLASQRLSVLELAKALGNVSEACRQRGTLRIGLHRVTVLVVDGLSLRVTPLDAIDCTPVIDLRQVMMSQ